MSGLNKVMLIGRLGKDPDVRATNSGGKIVSFSLATSETWRDKASGDRKEKTFWHNVVIFNENLAKVAETYLKKGTQVYVEGALQSRKYSDNEGGDRYVTEVVLAAFRGQVVLLESKDGQGRSSPESADDYGTNKSRDNEPSGGSSGGSGGGAAKKPIREIIDDDIPF